MERYNTLGLSLLLLGLDLNIWGTMNDKVGRMAESLDAKRDLLKLIKEINPSFYNEFVREFLTDPLTLTNFEKDLINALETVAGIRVYVNTDNLDVGLRYKTSSGHYHVETFDSYESALYFAIGLLHIK